MCTRSPWGCVEHASPGRTLELGVTSFPKKNPHRNPRTTRVSHPHLPHFQLGRLRGVPMPPNPNSSLRAWTFNNYLFYTGRRRVSWPNFTGAGGGLRETHRAGAGGGVGGRRPGRGNQLTYSRHDKRRQPSTKNGVNHTRRGSSLPTRRARNTSETPALVASKAAPSWPNNSRGRNRGSRGGGRGKRLCGERAWAESRGTTRAQL